MRTWQVVVSLLILLSLCLGINAQTIKGKVLSDNKGIANVVVSDGISVTRTDSKGKYQLDLSNKSKFVFISTPAGYHFNHDKGVPSFYLPVDLEQRKDYNFNLTPLLEDDSKHAFFAHADPQLGKDKEFDFYQEAIDDCKELLNNHPLKKTFFGIDCGDLVADRHHLYPRYIDKLGQLEIPFFRVVGNHDLNFNHRSNENTTPSYEESFGPTYYSFNRGNVHYVVLNSVFYLGHQYFYIGYLEEKMLSWLEQDLASVPEGSLVIVAMHIPTSLTEDRNAFNYSKLGKGVSNRNALYKILEPYNAHILSGHEHCNLNLRHTPSVQEHIIASIGGAWWQGAVCTDGTPCGYQVFEVDGDSLSWFYKSVGYDKSFQFKLYSVGYDSNNPEEIVANVWNWGPGWHIEWYENGLKQGEMTQCKGYDPDVSVIYADKDKLDYKWIGPTPTSHLFKARPADANALIEVHVTDPFGNVYKTNLNK